MALGYYPPPPPPPQLQAQPESMYAAGMCASSTHADDWLHAAQYQCVHACNLPRDFTSWTSFTDTKLKSSENFNGYKRIFRLCHLVDNSKVTTPLTVVQNPVVDGIFEILGMGVATGHPAVVAGQSL